MSALAARQDCPHTFCDVEFMTAKEKATVYRHWQTLVLQIAQSGLPEAMPRSFTEALYDHLHLHCGHIAHYDRAGFWDAQLGAPERAKSFFEAAEGMLRGTWPLQDYSDLNEAMYAFAAPHLSRILALLEAQLHSQRLAQMRLLAKLAGVEITVVQKPSDSGSAVAEAQQRSDVAPPTQAPPVVGPRRHSRATGQGALQEQGTLF